MSKVKIQQWLLDEAPDYEQGLALLRPHCANKGLLTALSKKQNQFNTQKLRYELEKVVAALPDEQPAGLDGAGITPPHTEPAGTGETGAPGEQAGATGSEQAQPIPPGPEGVVVNGTTEQAEGAGANGEQLPGSGLPPAIRTPADEVHGANTDFVIEDGAPAQPGNAGNGLGIEQVWTDEAAALDRDMQLAFHPGGPLEKFDPILAGLPVGSIQAPGGPQERAGHLLIDDPGKVMGASEEVQQALNQAREQFPGLVEQIREQVSKSGQEPTQEVLSALEALSVQASQVYVEKARLSNSLRDQATDAERKKVVDNIETLARKLDELNSQKEYILLNNRLPDQPAAPAAAEAPADKEGLTKDRNNLRSQVSKARGALKKNPNDVRKQQKLAQLEAELEQVETKLKTLDA